jgi:hypothetical protein
MRSDLACGRGTVFLHVFTAGTAQRLGASAGQRSDSGASQEAKQLASDEA